MFSVCPALLVYATVTQWPLVREPEDCIECLGYGNDGSISKGMLSICYLSLPLLVFLSKFPVCIYW